MRAEAWRGCYRDGWQGLIVPDAFAHPAKVSRGLAARIYDHCREEGWLLPGSTALDPFAGVALGALDCMRIGCQWVGIELEEKFVTLGAQNIALWNARYAGKLPTWGSAVIVQGDSRTLLAWQFAGPKVEVMVGSPPYAGSMSQESQANDASARIRRKELSGIDISKTINVGGPNSVLRRDQSYSYNPSNLGNLPPGRLDAVISSPPFSPDQPCASQSQSKKDYQAFTRGDGTKLDHQMTSPGQLGTMREGSVEAVVSSPPYEASLNSDHHGLDLEKCGPWRGGRTLKGKAEKLLDDISYHAGPSNLGNCSGDTFWSASRQILDQVFLAVRPGGHAIFVVKDYIRKGKRVPFADQWRQLCEAVGFRTLHEHRALLVEDDGTHLTTEGGEQRMTRERKSFFRRLAERKGAPRIDWETVWCLDRPPLATGEENTP